MHKSAKYLSLHQIGADIYEKNLRIVVVSMEIVTSQEIKFYCDKNGLEHEIFFAGIHWIVKGHFHKKTIRKSFNDICRESGKTSSVL